jgi:hypothetical protein
MALYWQEKVLKKNNKKLAMNRSVVDKKKEKREILEVVRAVQ